MTTQIQRRRGTTTQHGSFTGAVGEITIDTTKDTVVVHDGSTAGGHPLAKENNPTFTGNVGVGTSSPTNTLHVYSTSNTSARFESSTSASYIRFKDPNGDAFLGNVGNDIAFYTSSSLTERLRIDSSGRVGIGTSSPSQSLTLRGEQFIETNSTAADSGNGIYWQSTTSGWATSGAHAAIYGKRVNGSNGYLRFDTRSSGTTAERMRIDSSGNVGIGTASPGQLLHLSSSGPRILLTQTSANSNAFLDAATSGVLELSADDNNVAASSSMRFKVDGSEKLRIDSSGNVGIGTAAPSSKLEVHRGTITLNATTGSDSTKLRWNYQGTEYQYIERDNATGGLAFGDNTGEQMRIDSSGRLLVGTSSGNDSGAQSNLVIESNSSGGTSYGGLMLRRGSTSISSGTSLGRMFFADQNGKIGARISGLGDGTWATNDYPGAITFDTTADGASSPTERMRITSSGTVGIGTTSPAADLHVAGDDIYVGSDAVTRIRNNGSLAIISSTYTTGAGYKPLTFWTSDNERLRIDTSGNVGIGTSSPTSYAINNKTLVIQDSGNPAICWSDTGQTRDWWAVALGTALSFRYADGGGSGSPTNVTNVLQLDNTGNVGIGTTSPQRALVVSDDGAEGFEFFPGSSDTGNTLNHYDRVSSAFIDITTNADKHIFGRADGEKMRIDSSGNVGIGTSSPISELHVEKATQAHITVKTASSNMAKFGSKGNDVYIAGTAGSANVIFKRGVTSNTHPADSGTETVRITSAGNVELSSDAPFLYLSDNNNNWIRGSSSLNAILFGSNNAERMRIDSNGNVGIGDTNPGGRLDIGFNSNSEVGLVLSNAGTGTSARFYSGSSIVGSITVTGSATAYNTSSDYRLKENVVDIADGITRVKQLQPKRFNFIADAETTVDGFLAHEAQTVVPEAVTGTHNEVDDDGNAVMQGIDQSKLVPLLTAALQEAIAKIETLEAKVAALEAG